MTNSINQEKSLTIDGPEKLTPFELAHLDAAQHYLDHGDLEEAQYHISEAISIESKANNEATS